MARKKDKLRPTLLEWVVKDMPVFEMNYPVHKRVEGLWPYVRYSRFNRSWWTPTEPVDLPYGFRSDGGWPSWSGVRLE
jgi:hypothetical protein